MNPFRLLAADANRNESTGVYFGVLNGNNVPDLLGDIFSTGTDLTFEAFRSDLVKQLQSAIESAKEEGENLQEAVQAVFKDTHLKPERLTAHLDEEDFDDAEYVLEQAENSGLYDFGFDGEEHQYEAELGYAHVLVAWLGGAPLLYVIESDYVTTCRPCSPCVPNAGDLDSPTTPEEEDYACLAGWYYCLSPEDMPEGWQGTVKRTDEVLGVEKSHTYMKTQREKE